jgi:HAD superfamily hydrolase (TIGR01549 family)
MLMTELSEVKNHVSAHDQVLSSDLAGVIFDLDNTLVTSSLNFIDIKRAISCPPDSDVLQYLDTLPVQQKIEASTKIVEFEMRDAHSSSLLTGTAEVLTLLNSLKLPCAIVTRNCREATAIKLAKNGIKIDVVFSREDHKAKPAPDALLHIADLWQIPAEKLMYVGDYLYDVQAANNANMQSCLLTYGEQLPYAHLASLEVNDLNELSKILTLAFH